jgi:hypothetical protein
MSFEVQLLLLALVLPGLIAFSGACLFQWFLKQLDVSLAWRLQIPFLIILVIAMLASSSRDSLLNYSPEDYYRKLAWFMLFAYIVGVVFPIRFSRQLESEGAVAASDSGAIWIGRSTLLAVGAWWLIPKGKGWEDTSFWQPIWVLIAGLGATWGWWFLAAIRLRSASKSPAIKGHNSAWQLWIAIGALLGLAALAALSLATLAESILAIAAIGIGCAAASHLSPRKELATWSEPALSAALSGGTVLAMAYPSSSVWLPIYLSMMAVPCFASLVDLGVVLLGGKTTARVAIAFVVTTVIVAGTLAYVMLAQPAEPEW